MTEAERPKIDPKTNPKINWMDVLWLVLLAALALLPPIQEYHKQLILLAFGVIQLGEGWLIARSASPWSGLPCSSEDWAGHAADSYTRAKSPSTATTIPSITCRRLRRRSILGPGPRCCGRALASAAYCSFLYPALQEFEITSEDYGRLAIRIVFFFLAAMVVNRFVIESRRQTLRYQELAETLAETNRRLEQAQAEARRSERLAALGQLSAGLAHEIRNPLGVIKGSAEMLTQKLGESNPLATELAGYISTETNRLSALVTRFLDFARPLACRPDSARSHCRPRSRFERCRAILEGCNGSRGERLCRRSLPLVPLDESLCEQAFVNIVQNAYDAMSSSGGKLTVRVRKSRANVGDVRNVEGVEVRIEDNGPGIPPELREQIFNPFVTTKKTGVGLGLSIVSKIIDGHHGTIRIEGSERPVGGQRPGTSGTGARFVIFLPAASDQAATTKPAHLVIS